jgi:alkaline phosphatase D
MREKPEARPSLFRRRALQASLYAWMLAPLSAFARSETGSYRLMQGPMIGATGPDRVSIFARSSARVDITVEYARDPTMLAPLRAPPVSASPQNDYIARIEVTGLRPNTRYYYRVIIGDAPDRYLARNPPFSFRTAPVCGSRTSFAVAFGSCARIQAHPVQPIWDAVTGAAPDMFLWLGDNVYHDTLEPQIMDEMWRMQRNVPNLQPLLRSIPNYAIWDDHDYGLNDHDRENPVKEAALASFQKYWANPSYGLPDAPGVFFKFTYADVDFFMLDGRYYRDPNEAPDGPGKTMLGAPQLDWLKQVLRESRASFKVLACGSGWSSAKGHGGDSWASFITERNALFDFIQAEPISGVVLISGDTHVGELNAMPWSDRGAYDLYDLVSSPLAQETENSWTERRPELRIRQVYAREVNFGLMSFSFDGAPTLTYRLVNAHGQDAFAPLVLRASELRNGVRSWDGKIDDISRFRHEQMLAGRDYYSPRP